jgi:hypothetical protein
MDKEAKAKLEEYERQFARMKSLLGDRAINMETEESFVLPSGRECHLRIGKAGGVVIRFGSPMARTVNIQAADLVDLVQADSTIQLVDYVSRMNEKIKWPEKRNQLDWFLKLKRVGQHIANALR